jgi:hypothetical protein
VTVTVGEKTQKEEDANADLKHVVRDVKKKLTYEELDEPIVSVDASDANQRQARNSMRIAARMLEAQRARASSQNLNLRSVKSKSLDQRRPSEKFESLQETLPLHEHGDGPEELDCDFGLNESEEVHTLTDNSMEPDASETKRINMLI